MRTTTAGQGAEGLLRHRVALLGWPRHTTLYRLMMLNVLWMTALLPLPLRAQVVDFQPDLSGNGTVNTPPNGSTIVGIDATGTQSFSSSLG